MHCMLSSTFVTSSICFLAAMLLLAATSIQNQQQEATVLELIVFCKCTTQPMGQQR